MLLLRLLITKVKLFGNEHTLLVEEDRSTARVHSASSNLSSNRWQLRDAN
jgi:hypothetical protein